MPVVIEVSRREPFMSNVGGAGSDNEKRWSTARYYTVLHTTCTTSQHFALTSFNTQRIRGRPLTNTDQIIVLPPQARYCSLPTHPAARPRPPSVAEKVAIPCRSCPPLTQSACKCFPCRRIRCRDNPCNLPFSLPSLLHRVLLLSAMALGTISDCRCLPSA